MAGSVAGGVPCRRASLTTAAEIPARCSVSCRDGRLALHLASGDMRLRLSIVAVALPLAVSAVLPLSGGAASLSDRIERAQERDRGRARARGGPDRRRPGLHRPHQRAAGRHHRPAGPGVAASGRPRRQARPARRDPGRPARRARPPGAAARAADGGAGAALAAARRPLQGRQPGHAHRRPELRRLRRPARERRVRPPHRRARTSGSSPR